MAEVQNSDVIVSCFRWVPEFARGLVRDLRVRWALEEAGIDYAVRKLDPRAERPADYLDEQPFGQVPSFRDGAIEMFETGAIVLHIGEKSETLLPRDPQQRALAKTWVLAALNTIEPMLQTYAAIELFYPNQPWTKDAKAAMEGSVRKRLGQFAERLGDREWIEGQFSAGDLMLVTVLRILRGTGVLEDYPTLVAYKERGEARPAFQRALDAQCADFEPDLAPAA